ncbi:MAG TPA: S8 family serine peptidase, partial [Arenimonas sp.]|nr:S8 family serine peptidase [Arenimonas sp.]
MTHSSRKTLQVSTLAAATALAFAGAAAAGPNFRFVQQPVDGQYIVVLKEDVAALGSELAGQGRGARLGVADVARSMARQHGAQMQRSFSHALRGFVVKADTRALGRLLNDPRIAYIEEDGIVSINATQSGATWGIDRVDQRDLPLDSSYTYNTTASNVNAYIIDTGVLGSHQQFSGRMIGGYTAISDGNGTNDCNGHGTHVAGTVAGSTHGIAKGAKISPIRVLGCDGSGTNSGVIAGMDWVTANHVSPAVANMSLGGGASTSTDDAVERMVAAGVTVAVAAGNDNSNACNYSPARAASAITVGSTTSSDARSSFSNYGSCLDIFAPGSSITSAWYSSNTATNTISGTSMATPHVVGVAAQYLQTQPGASPASVASALNNNATTGKVTSPGSGSPNRLLYNAFISGGGGGNAAPSASFT